tara:strand:- start:34 stop:753 length:720 start_codon:yes stop_codon:yes gene_type:complete
MRKMFNGATSAGAEAVGRDYRLIFVHQATGHTVEFPAAIQSFTDVHAPEFSERVFAGRMDPIYQQSAVSRNIEFTFVVANGSVEEARHNRQSVNLLIQMLYPQLQEGSDLAYGSYINIKGLSFLNDGNDDPAVACLIRNINYSLEMDQGFITLPREAGSQAQAVAQLGAAAANPFAVSAAMNVAPNSRGELYPILLTITISAQALIPTIHSFEEADQLFNSEEWQQPYPPDYPNYYKKT